ncbi:MAG: hypothetical protein HY726_19040 [Candidatus Rokubacteria bacterium]|nr:hypothetical protein [Candidatus Rokubacteria bacterium]
MMVNTLFRCAAIVVGGLWLLAGGKEVASGFPGGGPGFGLLPVTDATPSCAGCHANTKAEYMRDVPPDAPLNPTNQLMSEKHYKKIEQGADAYKLLPSAEREKLLKQVKLVDQNSALSLKAPREVARGKPIKAEINAKGGIGPGSSVMLVDTNLRMQARPVQGNGWLIVGPPEVIGPDGKPQTFWVDKRFTGLAKNVNFVVVGGGADVDKGSYPTWKVTYTLQAPAKAGKYTLAAAFLYGTEEPNEHKEKGKWTLPPGGITGPSGRILFSEVVEVEVK